MNITLSTTYAVCWQLKYCDKYKFTKDGMCINTITGRMLQMKLKNRCKGFYINGKFRSLASLRSQLERIPDIECPF